MSIKYITCCKDCTKRYSGCHDKCDEYQKQKKEHTESKAKAKSFLTQANYINSNRQSQRVIRTIKGKINN